jgi:predicted Zn finger-like uncharacterized protein
MILTCPACHSRYRVDDKAMGGAAGRTVRCTSCGHKWHQSPVSSASAAPNPETAVPLVASPVEAGLDAPPLSAPLPDVPPPAALAALVLGGVFARRTVVAVWPPAARVYALAGLPVEPLGAGLEIRKVIPTRTGEGLVVEGEVVNIDGGARTVPQLRVALLDPAQKELRFEIIAPPKNRLEPGEAVQFRAPFAKPDDAATKVAVTWTSG